MLSPVPGLTPAPSEARSPRPRPLHHEYTVGWICALPEEYAAACRMLDQEFDGPETSPPLKDNNTYTYGVVNSHKVVMACLPAGRPGPISAARVTRDMARSFLSLRFTLLVGVAGGTPTALADIRLGDVVVSRPDGRTGGVVDLNVGTIEPDGVFQLLDRHLNAPPAALLCALPQMQRRHDDPRKADTIAEHMKLMRDRPDYCRPKLDRLYRADYEHREAGNYCVDCNVEACVERPLRKDIRAFAVHYGTIGSSSRIIKNTAERDRYALDPELNVLCYEREAAGVMNDTPCLVIRGISHYCDSHSNDEWLKYAALAAAAYARELLYVLRPTSTSHFQAK